jgi:hypothetical protein
MLDLNSRYSIIGITLSWPCIAMMIGFFVGAPLLVIMSYAITGRKPTGIGFDVFPYLSLEQWPSWLVRFFYGEHDLSLRLLVDETVSGALGAWEKLYVTLDPLPEALRGADVLFTAASGAEDKEMLSWQVGGNDEVLMK